MTLTARQARFVEEYLVDLNATAAAKRAGYSARTAEWQGPQLLGKPHVAAAVQAAMAARTERTEINADWVLKRLHAEATADIADLFDEDGALKPMSQWPSVWRRGLVTGIETAEERRDGDGKIVGRVRKVKLTDRIRVVELVGKHVGVGAFRDNVAHSGPNGGPVQHQVAVLPPEQARQIAEGLAGKV